MQSQSSLHSSNILTTNPAISLFLTSRQQYQTCRIQVPDMDHTLAAIQTGRGFYSFFRAIPASEKVLRIIVRLNYKNEEVAIATTPKGYSLWIREPKATPVKPRDRADSINLNANTPGSCSILVARNQYQPCYIRTPDLDQSLVAIQYQNSYYSFFRQEASLDRAFDLIAKIAQRQDDVILVKGKTDCVIYVHEPGAQPAKTVQPQS
jgi:hypothetical protein